MTIIHLQFINQHFYQVINHSSFSILWKNLYLYFNTHFQDLKFKQVVNIVKMMSCDDMFRLATILKDKGRKKMQEDIPRKLSNAKRLWDEAKNVTVKLIRSHPLWSYYFTYEITDEDDDYIVHLIDELQDVCIGYGRNTDHETSMEDVDNKQLVKIAKNRYPKRKQKVDIKDVMDDIISDEGLTFIEKYSLIDFIVDSNIGHMINDVYGSNEEMKSSSDS